MRYALDVGYRGNIATIGCIGFENWGDKNPFYEKVKNLENIEPYEAGSFYKRELPCLLLALQGLENIKCIIIDGYVWLENPKCHGLGMYLYEALDKKAPIIGVAKNRFKDTPKRCELLRGKSKKPLYITSVGMELEKAKESISKMYGDYRIPTLLKIVDSLSRKQ